MSASPETLVWVSVSALEYSEAAWRAHDGHREMPDPAYLSDEALRAVLRYERADLPSEARRAVEAERWRRVRPASVNPVLALAVLALLGIGGVIIGWILLVA
jgi:mono/diheme cytochrome c family protein